MTQRIFKMDFITSCGEDVDINEYTHAKAFSVPKKWLLSNGRKRILFDSYEWISEPIRLKFSLVVQKYVRNVQPKITDSFNFDEIIPSEFNIFQVISLINDKLSEQTTNKPFYFHIYAFHQRPCREHIRIRLHIRNPTSECYRFRLVKDITKNNDGKIIRCSFDEVFNQKYSDNEDDFSHFIMIYRVWERWYWQIYFHATFNPRIDTSIAIFASKHNYPITYEPRCLCPTILIYAEKGGWPQTFWHESFVIHAKFIVEE